MSEFINHFKDIFNRLDARNLDLLDQIYSPQVSFRDPVHALQGLPALKAYYARLYTGVVSCRFDFEDEVIADGRCVLVWTMQFEHASFCRGQQLSLRGVSHLKFSDKVWLHEDFFDMGAFIYERIPLLGGVVRAIKRRL